MGKPMTKSQIADQVAKKAGITKKAAVQILDDLCSTRLQRGKKQFHTPWSRQIGSGKQKGKDGKESSDRGGYQDPCKEGSKI